MVLAPSMLQADPEWVWHVEATCVPWTLRVPPVLPRHDDNWLFLQQLSFTFSSIKKYCIKI